MSRTTTALKRLAVPGLAAVTMIAGVPALVATQASAAVGDTITISPTADSASAGTCNPFTVTVKNSAGQPATSTVDVIVTERNNGTATAADTFEVEFCDTNTGTANQLPTDTSSTGTEPLNTDTDSTRGEFTPNAQGVFTFGVVATEAGIADIVAFIENSNDNEQIDTGEARATATKTFTAGTAADVRSIDAEPESQTNFVGETAEINATLRNAAGDTVAGITPTADITSGPNAAVTPSCTASDNDGVSVCSYSGAAGTDTIVVFLNQTNADNNPSTPDTTGPDAGEPQDEVTNTFAAAPTGLVVDLTCGDATTPRTTAEDCINPLTDGTEVFTATVTGPDGADAGTDRDPAAGVVINFTVSGNSFDTDDTETVSPITATTDANGVARTTLTNSKTTEDEVITVTATIRGQAAGAGTDDSATKTWNTAATTTARYIELTPSTATTTVGTFQEFSARVTNVNGEVVPGVTVTFNETGAGAFRNGSSSVQGTTDANGIARAEVTAAAVEAGGTQTIVATIDSATTDCELAAGANNTPPAGNCSDSSTNNYVAASSPSPSVSPTSSSAPDCAVTPTVTLEFGTINATGSSGVTVNAPANSQIQLLAYSQPSTTYRVVRQATIDNTGTPAQFRIVPPTNTRLYAQIVGCTTDSTRFSKVLNVRTTLSLNVTRTGTRAYRFFGDSLPARPGGLIVSLYRVTDSGSQVLTAQTRADAQNGDWVINRVFTGTGRFGFVVRTGQDLQNAPGASNVRSLLIF